MAELYALWKGRRVRVRFDMPVMDTNPPLYTIEYTGDDGQTKLEAVHWDDLDEFPADDTGER